MFVGLRPKTSTYKRPANDKGRGANAHPASLLQMTPLCGVHYLCL